MRDTVVEWFEHLAVVRKVPGSSEPGSSLTRTKSLENSLSTQQRIGTWLT